MTSDHDLMVSKRLLDKRTLLSHSGMQAFSCAFVPRYLHRSCYFAVFYSFSVIFTCSYSAIMLMSIMPNLMGLS